MQAQDMRGTATNHYLRDAVLTATPEQLQLMLYDGAIRFARQAREAMTASDFTNSCEKLLKSQRILVEMEAGLKHDVNGELCARLARVYRFVFARLVDANLRRDLEALDEALRVLNFERETWAMLVQRVMLAR